MQSTIVHCQPHPSVVDITDRQLFRRSNCHQFCCWTIFTVAISISLSKSETYAVAAIDHRQPFRLQPPSPVSTFASWKDKKVSSIYLLLTKVNRLVSVFHMNIRVKP
ncbi:unnamed protein product [Lactuca virosa]|uniref:Uncharacterized protein n=1 Tax=Lactuca virosa TaxID=75947 RepID=A0AAU9NHW9_9ASTR|nr:unnamed protein product [Lactuca virosa]